MVQCGGQTITPLLESVVKTHLHTAAETFKSYDSTETIAIYTGSILGVLKACGIDREYRGEGVWIKRKGDIIKASINRHCGHEHDCCGCCCRESLTFQKAGSAWVVVRSRGYNV
jgi:hypothetical protein